MNRRMKKKQWKEQTTAQQADLMERVGALEWQMAAATAELSIQRDVQFELIDLTDSLPRAVAGLQAVSIDMYKKIEDDLASYKLEELERRRQEAIDKAEREHRRWKREMMQQKKRESWARVIAFAAFGLALLGFALWLPV